MNDEKNRIEPDDSPKGTDTDNEDYIAAINEIKRNSVPREVYNKVLEEKRQLLNALVEGKQIDIPEEKPVDIHELRKDLFNAGKDMSNLEYVDKALQLRDALMARGERDPFLPSGDRVTITADMCDQAENVANVLRECIDLADGDSGVFTAELQRRTKDVALGYGRRR